MEGVISTTSKTSADSLSTATKLVASPLPQAIGSASFTAPGASVYCVVHGPQSAGSDDREFTDQGKFSVAVYLAPFARQGEAEAATRRQGDDSREEEEELAARVKEALLPSLRLECLKKSVLAVHLEIVRDSGTAFSACVTCASLALADSGLELNDLVASRTVEVGPSGDLVADPGGGGGEGGRARVTVCLMPNVEEVTAFEQTG
eukprot:CAMPEP_0182479008 /NCGR_PEP_ID=MMETSP1319-20130603/33426_1 /TAXON_ID=172717 /ORGANISM="Bolidomonas pacifica, Strain RCC208" /LENGTH=204 /DNA_ID=CAMNT_0024680399 /DNA_START=37 /DNA_END=647 /DNA_ORIENTATION=+